jgi:hypothetical protein
MWHLTSVSSNLTTAQTGLMTAPSDVRAARSRVVIERSNVAARWRELGTARDRLGTARGHVLTKRSLLVVARCHVAAEWCRLAVKPSYVMATLCDVGMAHRHVGGERYRVRAGLSSLFAPSDHVRVTTSHFASSYDDVTTQSHDLTSLADDLMSDACDLWSVGHDVTSLGCRIGPQHCELSRRWGDATSRRHQVPARLKDLAQGFDNANSAGTMLVPRRPRLSAATDGPTAVGRNFLSALDDVGVVVGKVACQNPHVLRHANGTRSQE